MDKDADGILAVTLLRDKRYIGCRENDERRHTGGETYFSLVEGDLELAWFGEVRPQTSLGI